MSITRLIMIIRDEYVRDWRLQRESGHRRYDPSRSQQSREMGLLYGPEFPMSVFKIAYIYEAKNWPMQEEYLDKIIEFFYVHKATPFGWPNLTKAIKEFEGGRFAKKIFF